MSPPYTPYRRFVLLDPIAVAETMFNRFKKVSKKCQKSVKNVSTFRSMRCLYDKRDRRECATVYEKSSLHLSIVFGFNFTIEAFSAKFNVVPVNDWYFISGRMPANKYLGGKEQKKIENYQVCNCQGPTRANKVALRLGMHQGIFQKFPQKISTAPRDGTVWIKFLRFDQFGHLSKKSSHFTEAQIDFFPLFHQFFRFRLVGVFSFIDVFNVALFGHGSFVLGTVHLKESITLKNKNVSITSRKEKDQ